MAHKVILPPQKNYIPQFLKQRDINSYYSPYAVLYALNSQHQLFDNKNLKKSYLIYVDYS